MSWMEKLHETYDNNLAHVGVMGKGAPLWPSRHITQNAQVEVIVDGDGVFQAATVVPKEEAVTIVPVTEESAVRTGTSPPPHPLHDKLQYLSSRYAEYGGTKFAGHEQYMGLLNAWCDSPHGHPKVRAVRDYLRKQTLIADLIKAEVLHAGDDGKLLGKWTGSSQDKPEVFTVLPADTDQINVFVRFGVQIPGDPQYKLWLDPSVWQSWIDYQASAGEASGGLCYVTGKSMPLATHHPKYIRRSGDGAKLISSNDKSGYTFRGRFIEASQACGVSLEVTQKAHSALRWLIGRQGYLEEDLAVVAWAVSGANVPSPLDDTDALLGGSDDHATATGDTAQGFGRRLARVIAGYKAELGPTDDIVVMALDSATTGRMAIKYYRELKGSEFLERLEEWHRRCAWQQDFGRGKKFVGAPAPRKIAEAAYGARAKNDSRLMKATIERLLPCIIDGLPIHRDLVDSCVRRACNRMGHDEPWQWEACLGVACALYHCLTRRYDMTLERDRTSRDYLYGRLLALADHLERNALKQEAGEGRMTTAGRLMQRFADRPFSTWRNIETALTPYRLRLRANKQGLLHHVETEFDAVMSLFDSEAFCTDTALSGEFLLGFHCQRAALWKKKDDGAGSNDNCDSDDNAD